jgi:hypothetical protein
MEKGLKLNLGILLLGFDDLNWNQTEILQLD